MLNSDTWFSGWDKLGTIAVTALTFYIYVVALVRIFGKRTTNQLNNFDWIITFAIGSIVASGILLEEVTVLDSALAILILAILQWLTTWTVLRSRFASKMVKSDPTLLLHKGRFIESAMITRGYRRRKFVPCCGVRACSLSTKPIGLFWRPMVHFP